jgi:hypothetical protein
MFAPFDVPRSEPIKIVAYDDMGHFMYKPPFPAKEVQTLIAKYKHVERFWHNTDSKYGPTPEWKRFPNSPKITEYNILIGGIPTDVTIEWDFIEASEADMKLIARFGGHRRS